MFREPIRTPVKINDTTYERELPNGKVEIGDKDSVDFKPTAKLKRWGEECSLVLSIPTTEKIAPTIQGEKILWTGRDYGAEFYQGTDGFKFNIILPKKPSTNVFPLDFQSDNLTFHYQPELTSEEIAEGRFRPENVVGSYAVYHASRGNMHTSQAGAEKYKIGKAFHWFRPLIYDNAGNQCWGILNVDPKKGLRTVTIPQEFLNNAVYPVTIDDTFGYTDAGGSYIYPSDDIVFTSGEDTYSPASNGTLDSISVYAGYSGYAKMALYDVSDNLIDSTDSGSIGYSAGWVTKDANDANVYSATTYRIAAKFDNGIKFYYDSGDSGVSWRWAASTFGDSFPNPISWSTEGSSPAEFSIYCTYTPSGGGETYNETGHEQVILAVGGQASAQIMNEPRGQVILAVGGQSGKQTMTEARGQVIVAELGHTDQAIFAETGHLQTVLASLAQTDLATFSELAHLETILAVIGESDLATFAETSHLQVIIAGQGESDLAIFSELGHLEEVLAILGEEDTYIPAGVVYDETGHLQAILFMAGESDNLRFTETGKVQAILVTTGESDTATFVDAHGQVILVKLGERTIRILKKIRRKSDIHNLGRMQASYNLGTMQGRYTLGEGEKRNVIK